MKKLASLVLALAAVVLAMPASAQFAKPEDSIKYRQNALFVMSQHFGRVGAMVQGRVPFDAKVATDNAEIAASMSKLPWAGFGAGTDKGMPTRAKAEIWSEAGKFKDAADSVQAEMVKLVAATKSGNLDTVKAAFGGVAASCKACHDAYRTQ